MLAAIYRRTDRGSKAKQQLENLKRLDTAIPWQFEIQRERQSIDQPIEFIAGDGIKGSDLVLKPGATLLIGETHGTWETPIAVASLIRLAVAKGDEAVLCIEVPWHALRWAHHRCKACAFPERLFGDISGSRVSIFLPSRARTKENRKKI
jgi:hypothetical protein